MKQKIYLLAIIITTLCLGLYLPKMVAYAQDRAEQREIAKQIMDLELELQDIQSEWNIMDDSKQELLEQVKDIEWTQNELHNRANAIRSELNVLKWNHSTASDITNCYEYTWELYNDCLDAYIQVGLIQSRQAQ